MDPRDWRYTGRRPTDMDRYAPYNTSRRPAYDARSYNTDNSYYGPPHSFAGPAGYQGSRFQFTHQNEPRHYQRFQGHQRPYRPDYRQPSKQKLDPSKVSGNATSSHPQPPKENPDPSRESGNASSSHGAASDGVKCEADVKQELDEDEECFNDDSPKQNLDPSRESGNASSSHGAASDGVNCEADVKQELDDEEEWLNNDASDSNCEADDDDDDLDKELNASCDTPVNVASQKQNPKTKSTCMTSPQNIQNKNLCRYKWTATTWFSNTKDTRLRTEWNSNLGRYKKPWEHTIMELKLLNTPASLLQEFAKDAGPLGLKNLVVCKLLRKDHGHDGEPHKILNTSFKESDMDEIVFEKISTPNEVYRAVWRDNILSETLITDKGTQHAKSVVATDLLIKLEYSVYTLRYNTDYYTPIAYRKKLQTPNPGVYRLVTKEEAPDFEAAWKLITDFIATDSDEDLIFTMFNSFTENEMLEIKKAIVESKDVDCIRSANSCIYVFKHRPAQYWRDKFLAAGKFRNEKYILEPPIPQRSQQQQTPKPVKKEPCDPKAVKKMKLLVEQKIKEGIPLHEIKEYELLPKRKKRQCEKLDLARKGLSVPKTRGRRGHRRGGGRGR